MALFRKLLFLGIFAAGLCASCAFPLGKKGETQTPPTAETVRATARTLSFNARTQLQMTESAPGACGAENVERCGCLAREQWLETELFVFDVVCCNQPGDTYVLYSCGEATCEDANERIRCR